MLFFSVVVMGIGSLFNLPVELEPETESRRLSVSAVWQGVSPEAMESQVTSVIEAELATIRGIKKVTSVSNSGSCSIQLEFHDSADLQFLRIEINEKLASLKKALPEDVIPVISEYKPPEFQKLEGFLTYEVAAPLSADEIQKYLEQYVLYSLNAVEGVSEVNVSGGNKREIQVLVDFNKAKNLGVENTEILSAVTNSQKQLNAGVIRSDNDQKIIFAVNKLTDVKTISEQIVKQNSNGMVIRISDISKVIDSFAEPTSYFRINGNDAVVISLEREPGTNILQVAKDVKEKVAELSKKFPAGFYLNLKMDRSEDMFKELNDLYSSAGYSLLIILLVLFIIFKNFRYPVIIFSSILFSLAFSFIFFNIFKLHLNSLTISSFVLGLGFMVDNSIVVVDYIDKNYKGNGNKHLAAVLKNIYFPVFASTFTTIAVFIPVMFFTEELRLYFQQFALGVVFTLIASTVVSFTLVPMLHERFAKKHLHHTRSNGGFTFKVYSAIVRFFANHKKVTIAIFILLIGLPVWKLPNRIETPVISDVYNEIFDSEFYQGELKKYVNYALGGTLNLFLNHVNRGEFYRYGKTDEIFINVGLTLPSGNKIDRLNDLVKKFEKEVLAYPGQFKTLEAHVFNEEQGSLRITFTPAQVETSFPYQLFTYLGAYGTRHGGLSVYVYSPLSQQGFSNGGFGGGGMSSAIVKIQGFNYKNLRKLAVAFAAKLNHPRVDKVDIDNSGGQYGWSRGGEENEIQGLIKRDVLARNNITIRQLFNEITNSVAGDKGSRVRLQHNNENVYANIKFDNYKVLQLNELENKVFPVGKELMKLKDFITFEETKVLSEIYREDQQYNRTISIEIKGPPQWCNNYIKGIIDNFPIPEGYKIKYNDMGYLSLSQEEEIGMILLFAVIIIFMISAGLFESFSKPFLVLFAIPFAIMGTIILFFWGDHSIDRGAYAGMLLLIGLSVNNSIILIHHVSTHFYSNKLEDLIRLSYSRFRSIFTTTVTTVAGLFPMMVSEQESFWKSLALSVTGGICLSAVFVIFFLPAVFAWFKIKKEVKSEMKVNVNIIENAS